MDFFQGVCRCFMHLFADLFIYLFFARASELSRGITARGEPEPLSIHTAILGPPRAPGPEQVLYTYLLGYEICSRVLRMPSATMCSSKVPVNI